MQPYQKASEAIRQGNEQPVNFLKNAGLTALGGATAYSGSKLASKIVPAVGALINKYVPDDLSKSGLSKVDPRFNKFIQGALDQGYTYDDIRGFIGEKLEKTESESQPAKEDRNIVKQYSPELDSYISEKIKAGEPSVRAGAAAFFENKEFEKIIEKIEKDHKTNWSDLVQTIYGRDNPLQGIQGIQTPQPMQQGQGQQQPGGSGSQALMAILQKIQQAQGGQ